MFVIRVTKGLVTISPEYQISPPLLWPHYNVQTFFLLLEGSDLVSCSVINFHHFSQQEARSCRFMTHTAQLGSYCVWLLGGCGIRQASLRHFSRQ